MAIKRRPPKDNVRRVKNSGNNIRGTIVSPAVESVQRESTHEKKFLLPLFRNKKYKRIISQPFVIPYIDSQGKPREYIPDAEAIPFDGPIEIHEFTLTSRREKNQEREIGARKFCQEKGFVYIVHTQEDLPSETEFVNLDALYAFQPWCYLNQTVQENLLILLNERGKMKIVYLIEILHKQLRMDEGDISNTIFHLIWHDEIKTDLEQLLIMDGEPNWKAYVWIEK